MSDNKRCPKCERTLPVDSFGWRDAAHTTRQGWCRTCLNRSRAASKNRRGRDGREHLRNHYEVGLTLCGQNADARTIASHFYDEEPTTDLPACADCARIDERACLEADAAQRQPRGPFEPNPYRQTYLAAVERENLERSA
jgi:hypothetical protein